MMWGKRTKTQYSWQNPIRDLESHLHYTCIKQMGIFYIHLPMNVGRLEVGW